VAGNSGINSVSRHFWVHLHLNVKPKFSFTKLLVQPFYYLSRTNKVSPKIHTANVTAPQYQCLYAYVNTSLTVNTSERAESQPTNASTRTGMLYTMKTHNNFICHAAFTVTK
jgi:hypothetical protein